MSAARTTSRPTTGAATPPQQRRAPSALAVMSHAIEERLPSFAMVATKYVSAERVVKLGQLALARAPDLAKCTRESVLDALMECARLGLEPHVPGGIWLIPFKDTRSQTLVATKVIDYRGMIDVARRSGEVAAVHADFVCAKDLWEYWIDAASPVLLHLRHRAAPGNMSDAAGRGPILGAYAIVKLTNGQAQAVYLTLPEINAYKARSKTANTSFSPWKSDENAMRLKTVIRRLYNLLPKNPEIQRMREALASEVDDIDNVQDPKERTRRAVRAIVAQGRAEDPVDAPTSADEAEAALAAAAGEGELEAEQQQTDDGDVEFETADEERARLAREEEHDAP